MNRELNIFVTEVKSSFKNLSAESLLRIEQLTLSFIQNKGMIAQIRSMLDNPSRSAELYRDKEEGFILFAYIEKEGTYRVPHNHGNGWVIYAVAEGHIEMGNYAHLVMGHKSGLILKKMDHLLTGCSIIYYPGEIHDTKCVSEEAIILRFTSCDLKEEELNGRMERFKLKEWL